MASFIGKYLYDRHGQFKLPILRSPLFLSVLDLKLLASALFASHYLYGLFLPFIKYFVGSGLTNPYLVFSQLGITNIFPYPSIMLWLLSLPVALGQPFLPPGVIGSWDIFLVRLPILAADLVIFLILCRWLTNSQRSVLLYYWCSPILFYISYLHGQLDALPIMFLFVALYFLLKDYFYTAMCFLGLAIATKTSIFIVWPFFLVYFITKHLNIHQLLRLMLLPIEIFLLVNFNYLIAPGFYQLVLHTPEQFKVFDFQFRLGNSFVLYIVPLAYLFLLLESLTYRTFNRDIFLMFLGFGFGLLTLFIPPMPGWYFWIIPFLVYFFIKNENAPRPLFWLLNLFYFAYFLAVKQSDLFEIFHLSWPGLATTPNFYAVLSSYGRNADLLVNIVFSLLQGILLLCVWWIYRQGIASYLRHKIYYEPYLIGVAGDSGSGKSTLAGLINDLFGSRDTLIIAGDDLHRWERGDANWQSYTPLDPRANRLHSDLANAQKLKQGDKIKRRCYDHQTGKFTQPMNFESKKVIIFEGLHSLFLNKMRQTQDLKIFMSPDEELRSHWKVLRDNALRGYDKTEVLKQIAKREPDAKQYIRTQAKYSDLIISLKNNTSLSDRLGDRIAPVDIYLEFVCSNDLDLAPLMEAVAKEITAEYSVSEEKQKIRFYGEIDSDTIKRLGEMIVPELDDLTAGRSVWRDGYDGLIQLFVSYYIFRSIKM